MPITSELNRRKEFTIDVNEKVSNVLYGIERITEGNSNEDFTKYFEQGRSLFMELANLATEMTSQKKDLKKDHVVSKKGKKDYLKRMKKSKNLFFFKQIVVGLAEEEHLQPDSLSKALKEGAIRFSNCRFEKRDKTRLVTIGRIARGLVKRPLKQ